MSDTKKTREHLYDIQSEEAFLSHACNDPKVLTENDDVLEKAITGERRDLGQALLELASAGEPLSEDSLRVHGVKPDAIQLFAKIGTITPSVTPAKIVTALRDIAARRELARGAADGFSKASGGGDPALSAIEAVEGACSQARHILQGFQTSGGISSISECQGLVTDIAWRVKNPMRIKGLTFGFDKMATILDGLQGGQLYLVGARPGVGKTALAGNITTHLAAAMGYCGVFFSLEMSKIQLQQRFLASVCGVNPSSSINAPLTNDEITKLRAGVKDMKTWPIWIDDTDRISIELIRSRARKAVSRDGANFIIVDYIQLVQGVEPKSRQSKREEVGEVSGKLKGLAKELNVPVIALAQLRRSGNAWNSSSSETEIPRPTIESLKESGDLEQDADAVILLHRDQAQSASEAIAIIAKNRFGSTGEVDLAFSNQTTSFCEI